MNFKTIYNYKPSKGVTFETPSMTHAEFQDECDINRIMDRYLRTGVLSDPLSLQRPMQYGDFTALGDYQQNMQKVVEAREMFERLPSAVRERFGNNPGALISFVLDGNNRDEAIKLGILEPKVSVISEEKTSPTEVCETSPTT